MFASRTIAAHLMRGMIAAALIAWALVHQPSDSVLAVAAGVLAVVAMRGCPLCWTIGLVETIGESIRAQGDPEALEGSNHVLSSWFSCFRGCICSSTTREEL